MYQGKHHDNCLSVVLPLDCLTRCCLTVTSITAWPTTNEIFPYIVQPIRLSCYHGQIVSFLVDHSIVSGLYICL